MWPLDPLAAFGYAMCAEIELSAGDDKCFREETSIRGDSEGPGEKMIRIALSAAALAAVLCFGVAQSRAQTYGDAPWCAVTENGAGEFEHDCEYSSIQECSPNVIAGNRGYCQMNPYYRPVPGPGPYRHHRHRHHAPPG